ncbi:phage polarity suppression protein [Serratia sp. S1B]|nr:phage polarity suppression protein [Serratia sp. S1B]
MNNMPSPQEALHDYRVASQNWLTLRSAQSSAQFDLAVLMTSDETKAHYGSQLTNIRERLPVLEWQISCAARDSLYAHRWVVDACVNDAITTLMQAHGQTLVDALAPYLAGPYGLEAAMNVLRAAIVHQAEIQRPVIQERYRTILEETGLMADGSMRADATVNYTPAKHKVFQDRL